MSRRVYAVSALLTMTTLLLAACSTAGSRTASVSPRAKSAGSVSPTSTTIPGPSPSPSLVYVGPGVAVVGITPDGYEGTGPSHLYLSTDMVRWKDVTPPQSAMYQNSG